MSRLIDLSGKTFGRLLVLHRAEDYVSPSGARRVCWRCRCECGKEVDVSGSLLVKGKTRSCGCLQKTLSSQRSLHDLTGNQYGRLTVMYRTDDYIGPTGKRRVRWHCKCACGNETDVVAKTLENGATRSCGCLKNETTAARFFINLTGKKYGRWTVLSRAEDYISPTGYQKTRWLCKCSCGTEKCVESGSLISGHSVSCGCLRSEITSQATLIDIIGHRFGRLTVRKRVDDHVTTGGRHLPRYQCTCECGSVHYATSTSLLDGSVKSCGCLQVDNWQHPHNFIDLVGRRFGKWTVIERANDAVYSKGGHDTKWLCQCDCGTKRAVLANSLLHGTSMSCGCWNQSKLEMFTAQYFNSIGMIAGVDYVAQQSFDDLTGLGMGRLRFDFVLYEDHELLCFVECQGEQHTRPIEYFGGVEKYETQLAHDRMKQKYAETLGIPLIEIPYTATTFNKVVSHLQNAGI